VVPSGLASTARRADNCIVLAVSSSVLFGLGCAAWLALILFLVAAFLLMRTRARRHAKRISLAVVSATTVEMALAMVIPLLALPIRQAGWFWLGYYGAMVVFGFAFHVARGVYSARHPGSGPDLFGPPELHEERLRRFDQMTQHAKWFAIYAVALSAVTLALTASLLIAAIVRAAGGGTPAAPSVTRQQVTMVFAKEGIHLALFPPKQPGQPWLALGPVRGGSVQVVIANRAVSLPHSLSNLRSGSGPHHLFGAQVVNNLLIQWAASPQGVRQVTAAIATLRRPARTY
jgi:hypothetical protein